VTMRSWRTSEEGIGGLLLEKPGGALREKGWRRVVFDPYLIGAFRLLIAAVFIYASLGKIGRPLMFADEIEMYGLLDKGPLLYLAAIILPWLELLCGVSLLTGIFMRGGALLLAGMNLVFLVVIAYRTAGIMSAEGTPLTGVFFDCGCGFGPTYAWKKLIEDTKPESNAVVICIMDTSGSMDSMKKYLARSFFFLLYQFVRTKYERVELVFVAHHSRAKEVTEEEFFYKGESGGTMISSGYHKALEIIRDRFHPQHWNIYAFHCSDGDNFESDNQATLKAAEELCDVSNLFGYGEIKPMGSHFYESSMLELFGKLDKANYQSVLIESKADIWPSFRAFLAREKAEGA